MRPTDQSGRHSAGKWQEAAPCEKYPGGRSSAEELLLQELNEYWRNGCEIRLNGRPSSPEKVAYTCVRDGYMRDIISDSEQNIREINFIRLKEGDPAGNDRREREKREPRTNKRLVHHRS